MEIVEQLKYEVSERAGSPEGFLALIKLILREVEKLDMTSPEAPRLYVSLLRAYVLVKRQLTIFNRRCENVAIDRALYDDTFRRLKYAIRIKRDEAREFAARTFPPEKVKELKRFAGTHMGFGMTHELTAVPIPYRDGSYSRPYLGQRQGWVDPRISTGRSYTRTN
jgi:hypothetical protein